MSLGLDLVSLSWREGRDILEMRLMVKQLLTRSTLGSPGPSTTRGLLLGRTRW